MAKAIPKIWKEDLNGYDPWKNPGNCTFDVEVARRVVKFFPTHFKHYKGEWAGKPFELLKWQKKYIGHLFGWKRHDGTRRYRTSLLYIPKKNGKTQLGAGIALLMLIADNEAGAEVYSAAGDSEQAKICFDAASAMVDQNRLLKKNIKVMHGYKAMKFEATQSYWKVLSAEARTKHGPNVHCLIIDELHVQRNTNLIETLSAGVIQRRQPLIIYMTTADHAGPSPCNDEYDYAKKVKNGIINDPEYLPLIYEADDETDDWTSKDVWEKANPNLGITLPISYFRSLVNKAKERPTELNKFKRLHLNIQTKTEKRWLDMKDWDVSGNKLNPDDLIGKECYAGLDLSSTTDISAFVLYFPEHHACLCRFWVPKQTAEKRLEYDLWSNDDYIEITDGNVIDYQFIRAEINRLSKIYQIKDIAYDPWNASQIAIQLADTDGLPMIEFRQGSLSLNEPSKEFEKLVLEKKLIHFGNPVLRWMASNVAIKEDASGNIRPVKPAKESRLKIDGIVSLVMAIGLSIGRESEKEPENVYNSRGLITL